LFTNFEPYSGYNAGSDAQHAQHMTGAANLPYYPTSVPILSFDRRADENQLEPRPTFASTP